MSQNIFEKVKVANQSHNHFDLSHDVKLSCNMGDLIPTLALDCVPGDRFNISQQSMVRLAPMVSPVMHRVDVRHETFFVPYRILWHGWEDFITNKISTEVSPFPVLTIGSSFYSKLDDYLGMPIPVGPPETISAMFHAAYQKIWNDYYRDQNLQAEVNTDLVDGTNPSAPADPLKILRKRCWEHDYFTSCLPFAQKGDPVKLPIGGFKDIPVFLDENDYTNSTVSATPIDINLVANLPDNPDAAGYGLYADTSSIENSSTTINDLRTANTLQRFLEKLARGGSRYFEIIRSVFGMRSPDARLQRPEFIGGTKAPVVISEVLNTTGTDDNPQGNMAGHGFSFANGANKYYTCQEHGCIISIMSIMPKTSYQQGIEKQFLQTKDCFEYLTPDFQNLGEQQVERREIFAFQGSIGDQLFGYIPRYAQYRFKSNRVAGDFRTSLDFWTMTRIFTTPPVLNETFIESDPTTRIFAVEDPDADKLYCQIVHSINAVRPLAKFGIPSF
jgi:hypothetical protein